MCLVSSNCAPSPMSTWWSRSLALAFIAGFFAACHDAGQSPATAIVLSGNDLGFIRPCGCSKPALGGIARRGGRIAALRAGQPVLAFSTGEMVAETGRQQEIKLESMLLAMNAMAYSGFAPGRGEFALGLEYLKQVRELATFPFVCANVLVGQTPVFSPSVALPENAWTVTGLVAENISVQGATVVDPVAALRAVAATTPDEHELLVLWNGPEEFVATLAAALPATRRAQTVFAVACTGDAPRPLAGDVKAMAVGSKGRDLVLVEASASPWWTSMRLEESGPIDAECNAILDGYRDAVRGEELILHTPRAPSAAYAAGKACRDCHEIITTQLADSAHMRALATLEATRDERDPECVRCHVVGLGDVTGWTPERPELANVDCEACHGPSEEHAQTQSRHPKPHPRKSDCMQCHDPDNSPGFEYGKYWAKIRHGH